MTRQRELKIGLLPLYLELYDRVLDSHTNREAREFADVIRSEYEHRSVVVVGAPACRNADEIVRAVGSFEAEAVDAIVTLHLAYSPSLEAIDAMSRTSLPIVVLDTTPDFSFGYVQTQDRVLLNHGIHGVQDLCNLLVRRKKPFFIEAGHWKQSDVIDRTTSLIRGLRAARVFRNQRVGIVGTQFDGMGDFAVPFDQLKRAFNIQVVQTVSESIARLMPDPLSDEVQAEIESDLKLFDGAGIPRDSHAQSVAAGLALRKWMEQESLDAVTLNFGDITGPPGLPVVPFLEASKAMARGIGYAGEGDVLTASLGAAFARVASETTFTEMFCPDWETGRVFMSHMGEMNYRIAAGKPVLELRPYPFSAANDPIIVGGCLRPGPALLLNVAPGPDETFTLIAVPVEVCDTGGSEVISAGVRGWIQPELSLSEFLERFSRIGGTHHCVLSYNLDPRVASTFASELGWRFALIDAENR